ncbi:hypothetical protein [Kribbella sp. C-35]|uniref:hypothetical protein n=1 Tax=Kribbella sp. C-35 TaxID=2789276 RepID=UPI00397CC9A8
MSMTGDEATDEVTQALLRGFRQMKRMARGGLRQVQALLSRYKRHRVGVEHGLSQGRWDPETDRLMQRSDGPDRTRDIERAAELSERNDALGQQIRDTEARNRDLRERSENLRAENDAANERTRDAEAERNNDRDGDGIPNDDVRELTDVDNDRIPDTRERDIENDQQNDNTTADADADRRRQEEQARADNDRRNREEPENQQNREDGIDPLTAGTAVGAAAAADEIADEQDERNADDRQENADADRETTVDADNAVDDRSTDADNAVDDRSAEADNDRQTDLTAEQDGVDPHVAEEGALDANDRLNENDGQQTDPALDADGQPKVDAENAAEDPSAEADNGRQAEPAAEQEGVDPYVAEEGALDNDERFQQTDLAQEGQDSALDGDELDGSDLDEPGLDANDGQQTDVSADQERVSPYVAEETGVDKDLQNDGTELGQDGRQVDPQQVEASGQGVEAGQDGAQPPQPKGPNTQQIANASQTAVDETAGLGQEDGQSGQTEGPSTSQAQGTQWRPPEQAAEDPAIAEAKGQKNGRPSGPGPELPPDEKATFDHVRTDQKPLTAVKVEGGGVATSERPGTPAAQRGQDRDRGGRGNDGRGGDGGRER